MKHYGDIKKLSGDKLPIVDVICGGSPCQDLSIAGLRNGLKGERSSLFLDQIRIIKEMRENDRQLHSKRSNVNVRPRYMVWENVVGALSSPGKDRKGEDFQKVLTEIVKVSEPDAPDVPLPEDRKWGGAGCIYDEMGKWSVAWRVHDAQFWGVPQRRKRIALVADFGGLSAPEVLFERKGMQGDIDESAKNGWKIPKRIDGCTETTSGNLENGFICNSSGRNIAGTLDASYYKGTGMIGTHEREFVVCCIGNGQVHQLYMSDKVGALNCLSDQQKIMINNWKYGGNVVRRLTPLECERLQGFPDNWTLIGERHEDGEYYYTDTQGKSKRVTDGARYKALGNSIAIPFWFYLMRRISAQYEFPATLGSLFDGIGGFPYCWERCNGKGTAIWASEIEEFAIAVTKARF